jgi:transformation/transcription domain-associated protein
MAISKRHAAAARAATNPSINLSAAGDPSKRSDSDQHMRDGTIEAEVKKEPSSGEAVPALQVSFPGSQPHTEVPEGQRLTVHGSVDAYSARQPWEYIDEVVQILKTASPLLILSMETMVDQINQRFKSTSEEEIYRLIGMLLQDALQVSAEGGSITFS